MNNEQIEFINSLPDSVLIIQFRSMTTRELVAYWNILTMGSKMLQITDKEHERHLKMIDVVLSDRGFKCEKGKTISYRERVIVKKE